MDAVSGYLDRDSNMPPRNQYIFPPGNLYEKLYESVDQALKAAAKELGLEYDICGIILNIPEDFIQIIAGYDCPGRRNQIRVNPIGRKALRMNTNMQDMLRERLRELSEHIPK